MGRQPALMGCWVMPGSPDLSGPAIRAHRDGYELRRISSQIRRVIWAHSSLIFPTSPIKELFCKIDHNSARFGAVFWANYIQNLCTCPSPTCTNIRLQIIQRRAHYRIFLVTATGCGLIRINDAKHIFIFSCIARIL